ncbi:hypothetical protein ACFQRC_07270 [Enterovirga sp. GCM10030262]|uniref:hypothetical protein n=1 Tax=Enterovirga sp. GCM10030262 TaxID=3273391 RepID=UPI003611FB0F
MLAALQPRTAENLTDLWAALQRTALIVVHDCEVHYLTAMALAADDDLAAHLLLKKLRIAHKATGSDFDRGIARMNSYVEFSHGDADERFCQIVHPSAPNRPSYGMGVTSLVGAGLIGLRSGQSILWPGEDGLLSNLHVVHVENGAGVGKWLEAAI